MGVPLKRKKFQLLQPLESLKVVITSAHVIELSEFRCLPAGPSMQPAGFFHQKSYWFASSSRSRLVGFRIVCKSWFLFMKILNSCVWNFRINFVCPQGNHWGRLVFLTVVVNSLGLSLKKSITSLDFKGKIQLRSANTRVQSREPCDSKLALAMYSRYLTMDRVLHAGIS